MAEGFLAALFAVLKYQVIGVAFFMLLELAFPKSRIPLAQRFGGFIFLLASAPLIAFVSAGGGMLRPALGIHPIELHYGLSNPIVASIALALWLDFQFYVSHRLEHRFLWRFHSVHHSVRNLSAANSYHHWTEPFWLALIALPLLFVDVQIGPTLAVMMLFFRYQQFYIHSASRPHFGPLRWLLVDNRYHRIHHSLDPTHHHRNFGALSPLWDWLFGTMYMPKSSEWPDVGLAEMSEAQSLKEWAIAPWRSGNGEQANQPAGPRGGSSEVLLDGQRST